MNQTIPFVVGSETSEQAAHQKRATAASDVSKVLAFIRSRGDEGATDDEIEVALGFLHQNASARRNSLVKSGLVCNSGRERATRSGRKAVIWILGAGVPLQGAPNHRVARPSNEQMMRAADTLQVQGGNEAVGRWLQSIATGTESSP